jgi:hypothetical protein
MAFLHSDSFTFILHLSFLLLILSSFSFLPSLASSCTTSFGANYCCPSDTHFEPDPRGTGPKCTQCAFNRNWCADEFGLCCPAYFACSVNGGQQPTCTAGAGANLPIGTIVNRSETDVGRDRAPEIMSSHAFSVPLAVSLVLGFCLAAGTILVFYWRWRDSREHSQPHDCRTFWIDLLCCRSCMLCQEPAAPTIPLLLSDAQEPVPDSTTGNPDPSASVNLTHATPPGGMEVELTPLGECGETSTPENSELLSLIVDMNAEESSSAQFNLSQQ